MIQDIMKKWLHREKDFMAAQKGKLRLEAKHVQELNLPTRINHKTLLAWKYVENTYKKNLLTFIAKRKTFIFALAK